MNLFRRMQIRIKSKLSKNRYDKKQRTFCFCPQCRKDLVSSNSFVSDKELVTYKCSNCGCISRWNFDIAPVAVLIDSEFKACFDDVSDLW